MIDQSPSILALLKQLQRVPYLASKNLYVVAQYFLDLDDAQLNNFCRALIQAKEKLDKCEVCWIWKEKTSLCSICKNPKRDKETICVVENWKDLIALEKAGGYSGHYHVLGGVICPLEGVGPDELEINSLLERIRVGCKELIFAFNQTPEGEATSAYITSKISSAQNIVITCLAQGLPVGSSLSAMDRLTVYKALANRKLF